MNIVEQGKLKPKEKVALEMKPSALAIIHYQCSSNHHGRCTIQQCTEVPLCTSTEAIQSSTTPTQCWYRLVCACMYVCLCARRASDTDMNQ